MRDDFELGVRDKKVQRMTRDGLVEDNLTKQTTERVSERALDADFVKKPPREMDYTADRQEIQTGSGKKNRLYQKQQSDSLAEHPKPENDTLSEMADSFSESIMQPKGAAVPSSVQQIKHGEAYITAAVETAIVGRKVKDAEPLVVNPTASHTDHKRTSGKEATMKSRRMQGLEVKSEAVNAKLEQAQHNLPTHTVIKHQRLFEEETGKVKHCLVFEDEAKSLGKVGVTKKAATAVTGTVSTVIHGKVHEAEEENSALEALHKTELAGEGTAHAATRMVQKKKAKPYQKVSRLEHKAEKVNTKLLFERAAEKNPELRKKGFSQIYQKHKLKKKYTEAYKATKNAGAAVEAVGSSAASGGSKLVRVIQETFKKNKAVIVSLIALILLLVMLASGLGSCAAIISESGGGIVSSTYLSSDNNITSTDTQYSSLETALQNKIDHIESTYPGYDEYRYTVDEVTHDPYALISYLTAKYGNFTYAQVQSELQSLFDSQYTLTITPVVEVRYREEERTGTHTTHNPDGSTDEETYTYTVIVAYNYYILNIKLTNKGLDAVVRPLMNEDQLKSYQTYQATLGNRSYLFGESILAGNPAGGGISYEIPPEALQDADFRAMITEAERYLGYPYVWGGSSPSTSFDCSGFVSWVINHSVGSVGRQTANGLMGCCTYVAPNEAKPGDLIFFQGTYNTSGASHVGIYVGNGMMIHCGNPIQYASIETNYWKQHFYCFGRLN